MQKSRTHYDFSSCGTVVSLPQGRNVATRRYHGPQHGHLGNVCLEMHTAELGSLSWAPTPTPAPLRAALHHTVSAKSRTDIRRSFCRWRWKLCTSSPLSARNRGERPQEQMHDRSAHF